MKITLENFEYKGRYYEFLKIEINEVMTPEEIYNHVIKILERESN